MSWVRIGSDLELLGRGRRRAPAASVVLDRRSRATRRRKRFRIPIDTAKLRPGPHKLVVSAHDAAGNLGRFGTTFTVCPR